MAGINDIYQGLSKRKEKKRTNGIVNANIYLKATSELVRYAG